MKAIFLLSLMLLLSAVSDAQRVQSSVYNLMLKSLLSHDVKEIGVKAANADTSAIFIDAREKKEFEVSHIKNAIWCGYDDFDVSRLKNVPKTARIIIYCSVGYRSEKITEKLVKAGFSNASNLYGGIFEWKNQGYVLVDNRNVPTNKVHGFSKSWSIWLKKGEKIYN